MSKNEDTDSMLPFTVGDVLGMSAIGCTIGMVILIILVMRLSERVEDLTNTVRETSSAQIRACNEYVDRD